MTPLNQTAKSNDTFWKNIAFHVTTSFIPTAVTSSNNKALTPILIKCVDNPVRVDAAQIAMWFVKCVDFINGKPSTIVSDSRVGENLDVDMLYLSVGNAQDDHPKKANQTNLLDTDSNVSAGYGDVNCENVLEHEPDESKIQQMCHDYINRCIGHEDVQQIENILEVIISQDFPYHSQIRWEMKKHTKLWLTMLRSYNDHFIRELKRQICVDDLEFEKLHVHSLKNANEAVGWNESENVNKIIEELIVSRKTIIRNMNKLNYEKEMQFSDEAHQFAVMCFKTLLDGKLSISTFSENDFQAAYSEMVSATSELFLKSSHSTKPWMDNYERLTETLSSMQTNYTLQNRNKLSKIDQIRRNAIKAAVQCYQDEMDKTLPGTKLPRNKLESASQSCSDVATRVFRQKIGKSISENTAATWEKEMIDSTDKVKLDLIAKNEKLPAPSKPEIQLQPGIGLYIDHHSVIICMDQQISSDTDSFEYDQHIAIYQGELSFGMEASSKHNVRLGKTSYHYHTVFALLTDHSTDSWPVNIDDHLLQTEPDVILSMYFHEIRMEIERRVKKRISSCFVAITGLLTSGAKQILKTSLTIAGFEKNTLIPTTTAMAILYSQMLRNGNEPKIHPNLFIYTSSSLIEVALADVSSDCVKVLKICGNYKNKNSAIKTLDNILRECSSVRQFNNIIFWCAQKSTLNFDAKLAVKKFVNEFFHYDNTTIFNTSNVISVTAMLDSFHNNHLAVHSIPQFNFIHPYRIFVYKKRKGDYGKFRLLKELTHNIDLEDNNELVQQFRFVEQVKAGTDTWIVGDYALECWPHINVSLETEGNLLVTLRVDAHWKVLNTPSMISIARQNLIKYMKPIIEGRSHRFERKYGTLEQPSGGYVVPNVGISSSNTVDAANAKLLDDLKKSVTVLIEKTKLELINSELTPAAHRDNIESKINKCETLMKSTNIKVKQLEIEKSLLERASTFIK